MGPAACSLSRADIEPASHLGLLPGPSLQAGSQGGDYPNFLGGAYHRPGLRSSRRLGSYIRSAITWLESGRPLPQLKRGVYARQ